MTVLNFIRVKFCPQLSIKGIYFIKKNFYSFDNNNVIQLPPTYVRQVFNFYEKIFQLKIKGSNLWICCSQNSS